MARRASSLRRCAGSTSSECLWARYTVRQVHDILSANRDFAYDDALKLLQLMTEKGVTFREEDGRVHL